MNHQPYPDYLFDADTRHLMVFAHQDDEINYTGLIQRFGAETDFIWVTNGDGLAPFENADPKTYAEMRKAETDAVLETVGRPLERRECLDFSEIEIYDNFVELTLNPGNKPQVIDFMYRIGCELYRRIKALKPQVVWTCQYQNGHPEHDLTHILTAYALRQLEREEGHKAALYQVPEYEYTILIPMRFHPLYKDPVHRIELTAEEMRIKRSAFDCYPSQKKLFDKFERVIGGINTLGRPFGKPATTEGFLGREFFGPVSETLDYSRSFHVFEWANYMFDKNKGIKVRHDKHLGVIAAELRERPFA